MAHPSRIPVFATIPARAPQAGKTCRKQWAGIDDHVWSLEEVVMMADTNG